jgi:hypothetical protein
MSKQKPASRQEPIPSEPESSPLEEVQSEVAFDDEGVRAMYKRLAQDYRDHEPIVPDCGGGVPGDLYDL